MRKHPGLMLFLGLLLGISLTLVTVYAVMQFSPNLLAQAMAYFAAKEISPTGENGETMNGIDTTFLKGMIQDILTSEQGKAIVSDLVKSQSQDTFETFFAEAMKNPDFRSALSDALGTFLQSAEGKALIKKVAQEAMSP
ncbi:MAG TPA: hypothetical protein GXX23_03880 [Firmicutes bacterium]|nr:hypothetical protein [Candidatus Fermentithermobacillaceae bacterium]